MSESFPIGKAMKEIRKRRGLSMREAEELTGVKQGSIANIEQNFWRFTMTDTVAKLLRGYGCSVEITVRDPEGAFRKEYPIRAMEKERKHEGKI